jgi:septal ring-binding cell division protein DamX
MNSSKVTHLPGKQILCRMNCPGSVQAALTKPQCQNITSKTTLNQGTHLTDHETEFQTHNSVNNSDTWSATLDCVSSTHSLI